MHALAIATVILANSQFILYSFSDIEVVLQDLKNDDTVNQKKNDDDTVFSKEYFGDIPTRKK